MFGNVQLLPTTSRHPSYSGKMQLPMWQRWFCSVDSPCITERIHWSHPFAQSRKLSEWLLWIFGVCSFFICNVTLLYPPSLSRCSARAGNRLGQYIANLSICYQDMTCYDSLLLRKWRSACSILGQNIDISFGPNGAPLWARWWSTLRAASCSDFGFIWCRAT